MLITFYNQQYILQILEMFVMSSITNVQSKLLSNIIYKMCNILNSKCIHLKAYNEAHQGTEG